MKKFTVLIALLLAAVLVAGCSSSSSAAHSGNETIPRQNTETDFPQTQPSSSTNQTDSVHDQAPADSRTGSNDSVQISAPNSEQLADSCDYILCSGYDDASNEYALVANQSESSKGFEISVGVIKNNSWLYPMSTDFPFLAEDGLFHVYVSMAGESGTSLKEANEVINNLYFIDAGAFMLDCYKANDSLSLYDHYYLIFSCTTLETIKLDCSEVSLLYRYSEPTFSSGSVKSFGQLFTDNGKLIMYSETSGTSSGWLEDCVFDWSILDTSSLDITKIASDVKGICPKGILSEGLFLCSDKCFYNTNGQKSIDLSEYSIDIWNQSGIFFKDGKCTFEVKNSLGTKFLITIDSSGTVLSEEAA